MKLKLPKNKGLRVTSTGDRRSLALGTQGHPNKSKGIASLREERTFGNAAKSRQPSQVVTETQQKHREHRSALVADYMRENSPSGLKIEKIWTNAWREVYSSPAYAWKKKDMIIARKYCVRWAKQHDIPFGEYIDWCVRSWGWIMTQAFLSMRDKPELPSLPFLVRFSSTFENLFAHRAEQQMAMSQTTRQREIQKRLRRGMPLEVAEQDVDDALGVTRERVKLAQEREDLERRHRTLILTQHQLDKRVEQEIKHRERVAKLPGTAKERLTAERAGRRFRTSDYEQNSNGKA